MHVLSAEMMYLLFPVFPNIDIVFITTVYASRRKIKLKLNESPEIKAESFQKKNT